MTLSERFWARVDITDGCWLWTGASLRGYGKMWSGTYTPAGHPKTMHVHRYSYELHVGLIPEGMDLDHLCRNRLCVRPDHLQPVTRRENIARGESIIARQIKQTHCIHGHEFTEENTYRHRGHRYCRTCREDVSRRRRRKRQRA